MPILFKPTGSLDINTAPTDLPEQADGRNIVSGAMARCKNLRTDRHGIARLRHGSSLVISISTTGTPESILETGGHRYEFFSDKVYYDEVEMASGIYVPNPTFSPEAGAYLTPQSVTISCTLSSANIYYTTDGTTPDVQSTLYTSAITVPESTYLKAIAIDPRGLLGSSAVVTGYFFLWAQNALITETDSGSLVSETEENNITTEGP
jgi:hypothetical protein